MRVRISRKNGVVRVIKRIMVRVINGKDNDNGNGKPNRNVKGHGNGKDNCKVIYYCNTIITINRVKVMVRIS